MASTTSTGFRGPAKRAALGDLSNVTKHAGHTRDDGKVVKSYDANTETRGRVPSNGNKENVANSKESFTRPAQRPTTRLALDTKPSEANRKTTRTLNQEASGQSYAKKDVHVTKASTLSSTSNAPALQPRHYKSQPQLKQQQQQPSLRRTQSKQFEKIELQPDVVDSRYGAVDKETLPLQDLDYAHEQPAYLDTLYLPIEQSVEPAAKQDDYSELPAKLAGISEEDDAAVAVPYQHGPVPAMSEPEECWEEEDDEDFDDQDQAYTTAHSFRSRDLTAGGATMVLAPRLTTRVQRELEEARDEVERTRTQDEVDEEMWDVSMVAEYGEEIFEYMRELEVCQLMCIVRTCN